MGGLEAAFPVGDGTSGAIVVPGGLSVILEEDEHGLVVVDRADIDRDRHRIGEVYPGVRNSYFDCGDGVRESLFDYGSLVGSDKVLDIVVSLVILGDFGVDRDAQGSYIGLEGDVDIGDSLRGGVAGA